MTLTFDHLIHPVHDPHAARLEFSRIFKMDTVAGGVHPQWGTFNTLCYLESSYLEWIGLQDKNVAQQSEFGLQVLRTLESGERAVQFALRTTNMDDVVRAWEVRGLPFVGPVAASRTRPDGSVLSWRMLFPEQDEDFRAFRLPFLIEWGQTAPSREAMDAGTIPHIEAIHCRVQDIEHLVSRMRQYVEFDAVSTNDPVLGEGLVLPSFHTRIYLWQPVNKRDGADFGTNCMMERPFRVDIASHTCQSIVEYEFHGLSVRIVPRSSSRL